VVRSGAQARGGAVRRSEEAKRGGDVEEEPCATTVPPVGEVKGIQRYAGLDGPPWWAGCKPRGVLQCAWAERRGGTGRLRD
jgi:hypothetical protein